MLAIDGKLREPGAVEQLMQYAFDRLRTGIAATTGWSADLRRDGGSRAQQGGWSV